MLAFALRSRFSRAGNQGGKLQFSGGAGKVGGLQHIR